MSPLLRSVREAGQRGLARRATPWRIEAADWFTDVERLRDALALLIGADSEGTALVPASTSFGLVPMAIAATEQILSWTVAGVAESLCAVTRAIASGAAKLGLSIPPDNQHGPHMLGIDLPREAARMLGGRLATHGVIASVRGNALRLAPRLHTTESDIDRLLAAFAATAR